MTKTQLAIKAIGMQRDYSNPEIAQLLDVRLEDLTEAIEKYKGNPRWETENQPKADKTKPKEKKKKQAKRQPKRLNPK